MDQEYPGGPPPPRGTVLLLPPPLSLVRAYLPALYDWEHLNALQRDPAEANPMRLTGAIAEQLLSRIEELEHSVSQSVSHLEDS